MKIHILPFALWTLVLMFIPKQFYGQALNLGNASKFALFTEAGAFTNTGATSIWGDIGTNIGAYTGSPTVTGHIYLLDSNTALAGASVDTAYAHLGVLTCGTTISTTIGNSQVLTAHVYCLGSASTLNGNLYLDAKGNANAVFIFKIGGALFVNKLAKIVLLNNASQNNVYWQVDGAFTLSDSSVFMGTIVANSAINLLNGAILWGRALARAGAITLNNNFVSINSESTYLPVKLISFTSRKSETGGTAILYWQTALEINSAGFLIERSNNGVNFETIGKCAAAGNSRQTVYYSYVDTFPLQGTNYYRLKQWDNDGSHIYSTISSLSFPDKPVKVDVYPNPFTTFINIRIKEAQQITTGELKIYNMLGIEVMRKALNKQGNTFKTDILPPGIYFYKVVNQNEIIQSGKLISQNI